MKNWLRTRPGLSRRIFRQGAGIGPVRPLASSLVVPVLVVLFACCSESRGDSALEQKLVVHVPALDGEWRTRLVHAERLIRGGDYRAAIEILQRAMDFAEDRLYLVSLDEEASPGRSDVNGSEELEPDTRKKKSKVTRRGVPPKTTVDDSSDHYISVAEQARRIVVRMPPAGRRFYRSLYDGVARSALAEARTTQELSALRRVALNYFPTPSAIEARRELGDRYVEQGRLRRALKVWRTTLAAGIEDPLIEHEFSLRVLMLLRALGERKAYRSEKLSFVQTIRNQGGTDGLPREEIQKQLNQVARLEEATPMAERSRVSYVPVVSRDTRSGLLHRLPALREPLHYHDQVWMVPWSQWESNTGRRPSARQRFSRRGPFSFFPAVDDKSAYVSGVFKRWRINRENGLIRDHANLKRVAREALDYTERGESPLYAPVVDDDLLFTQTISFLREHSQYMRYTIEEELPWRSLVAQDKASGRVLWDTRKFKVGMVDDPKRVSFVSPPIVVGDRVIVGGWFHAGYVNALVVAFDRRKGTPLWKTLLASNQVELTMFGEPAREPLSWVLLEDEGIVYSVTNLGAVAAIDADDGHVHWLTTYESLPVNPTLGKHPEKRRLVWDVSPPLLHEGVLLTTPRDSKYLYAFDTGLRANSKLFHHFETFQPTLWRLEMKRQSSLRHLLGYRDGRLYVSGPMSIDAVQCDPPEVQARVVASHPFEFTTKRIRGRPALVEQGILYSDADHIRLVDYDFEKEIPLTRRTLRNSNPRLLCAGNVAYSDGQIFLMSRQCLTAFVASPDAPIDAPVDAPVEAKSE